MATPKAEANPDTKSRILDAALALFNQRGSANVTTNRIAEALGRPADDARLSRHPAPASGVC